MAVIQIYALLVYLRFIFLLPHASINIFSLLFNLKRKLTSFNEVTHFTDYIHIPNFCFVGVKMLMYKTGDHDNDFIFKIIGIVIFVPFFLLLLSGLRITG